MSLLEESKIRFKMPTSQELSEVHGINSKFLEKIGIKNTNPSALKVKNNIKLYIAKRDVEKFQAFSIYLELIGYAGGNRSSISRWFMDLLHAEVQKLILDKDPVFQQAINLLKDLKTQQFIKDEQEYNNTSKL